MQPRVEARCRVTNVVPIIIFSRADTCWTESTSGLVASSKHFVKQCWKHATPTVARSTSTSTSIRGFERCLRCCDRPAMIDIGTSDAVLYRSPGKYQTVDSLCLALPCLILRNFKATSSSLSPPSKPLIGASKTSLKFSKTPFCFVISGTVTPEGNGGC
jgi:hypothetical protein